MAYFAWLGFSTNDATTKFGYYGLAASFIIPLVPVIERIFWEKENPSELAYRAQQLTKPLQKIHANLACGARLIPEAVNLFEAEIEHQGLLTMLKQDSPALVESMGKLKTLARRVEIRELTGKEKMMEALHEYGRDMSREAHTYVLRLRLENNEEAKQLVKKVQQQIGDLIAKYGGFH
jgi:flagellar biosynthesis/type III secretory pathway chaperone